MSWTLFLQVVLLMILGALLLMILVTPWTPRAVSRSMINWDEVNENDPRRKGH